MVQSQKTQKDRGRLDHVLPRGYLRGFTNPSKEGQLSVYNAERKKWFEASPDKVAAIKGFYDYSLGSQPDQTADEVFQEFEEKLPPLRRDLVAANFSGWKEHLDFLLRYAQMLRVRSELFRQQSLAVIRTRPMVTVKEVSIDPETGNTTMKYEEMTETPKERETLYRNMAITTMREEIAKGAALFADLNWRLRLAPDAAHPVITSDYPIIVDGSAPNLNAALADPKTKFYFPLCRHACLIGGRESFDVETAAFQPLELKTIQSRYLTARGCRFTYAPSRVML